MDKKTIAPVPEKQPTFAEYQAIEAEHWSGLKEMVKSPAHYRYRLENPREDTSQMAIGRAVHTAVFEPDRLVLDYVIWKGGIKRGKEWEAFKSQHPEETILKPEQYEKCLAIRDAVRSHPLVKKHLEGGVFESTIQWTDRDTGLPCKARVDFLSGLGGVFFDLKVTSSVDLGLFRNTAARLLYHGQLAFYADGLAAAGETRAPLLIPVENEAPHTVMVASFDSLAIEEGRKLYKDCLYKVAQCRETGVWPTRYEDEVQALSLPHWMATETKQDEAEDLGLVWRDA